MRNAKRWTGGDVKSLVKGRENYLWMVRVGWPLVAALGAQGRSVVAWDEDTVTYEGSMPRPGSELANVLDELSVHARRHNWPAVERCLAKIERLEGAS